MDPEQGLAAAVCGRASTDFCGFRASKKSPKHHSVQNKDISPVLSFWINP